jgi:O-antigen/teichoic acid export membrane protein
VVKRTVLYGLSKTLSKGINWAIMAALPALLAPTQFGIVGLVVAVEGILRGPLLLGQDRALLRFYHHVKDSSSLLRTILTLWMRGGFVFGVATALTLAVWPHHTILGIPKYPHLALTCMGLLPYSLYRIGIALVRVKENARRFFIYECGYRTLKAVLVFAIAFILGGSISYVAGAVVAVGIAMAAQMPYILAELRTKTTDLSESTSSSVSQISSLWAFGWPLLIHTAGGTLLGFVDRFMLQYFTTTAEVGVYSLGYSIGAASGFVLAALAASFEPKIYKHSDETEKAEKWLAVYTVLCIFGISMIGLIVTLSIETVVNRVYSSDYASVVVITPIIISSYVSYSIYRQANYRTSVSGKNGPIALASFMALIVNVGANLYLIPVFGAYGAAVSTVIGHMFLSVFLLYTSLNALDLGGGDVFAKKTMGAALTLPLIPITVGSPIIVAVAFGGMAVLSAYEAVKIIGRDQVLFSIRTLARKVR